MLEPSTVNQAKTVNHKISSSSKKLSRVNSFAKEEDMEWILEEVETGNLYSPSSKNAKKRPSVVDEDSQRPDEELEQFFLDAEKRNAELQELLQLVETTRQENEGQISREASAGVRGSTDSLVEKLMRDLENVGWENSNFNSGTVERTKSSSEACDGTNCAKLRASASEEELDEMLADLLEL